MLDLISRQAGEPTQGLAVHEERDYTSGDEHRTTEVRRHADYTSGDEHRTSEVRRHATDHQESPVTTAPLVHSSTSSVHGYAAPATVLSAVSDEDVPIVRNADHSAFVGTPLHIQEMDGVTDHNGPNDGEILAFLQRLSPQQRHDIMVRMSPPPQRPPSRHAADQSLRVPTPPNRVPRPPSRHAADQSLRVPTPPKHGIEMRVPLISSSACKAHDADGHEYIAELSGDELGCEDAPPLLISVEDARGGRQSVVDDATGVRADYGTADAPVHYQGNAPGVRGGRQHVPDGNVANGDGVGGGAHSAHAANETPVQHQGDVPTRHHGVTVDGANGGARRRRQGMPGTHGAHAGHAANGAPLTDHGGTRERRRPSPGMQAIQDALSRAKVRMHQTTAGVARSAGGTTRSAGGLYTPTHRRGCRRLWPISWQQKSGHPRDSLARRQS